MTPAELAAKFDQIRQLQTRLRNEEMSLVLLKKIRSSQLFVEQAAAAAKQAAAVAANANAVSITKSNQLKSSHQAAAAAVNNSNHHHHGGGHHNHRSKSSILTPDLSHLTPVGVVRSTSLPPSRHNTPVLNPVFFFRLVCRIQSLFLPTFRRISLV